MPADIALGIPPMSNTSKKRLCDRAQRCSSAARRD
jgi:hypothetical protein